MEDSYFFSFIAYSYSVETRTFFVGGLLLCPFVSSSIEASDGASNFRLIRRRDAYRVGTMLSDLAVHAL